MGGIHHGRGVPIIIASDNSDHNILVWECLVFRGLLEKPCAIGRVIRLKHVALRHAFYGHGLSLWPCALPCRPGGADARYVLQLMPCVGSNQCLAGELQVLRPVLGL